MRANVIRLFEHVKLLQRGVDLFQKQKGESCQSLRNGFNGKNVQIGLLGATSAGKTTLIRRLLSESAGKISSKPETACLVVHSFSKSENLKLEFRPRVKFADESIGREFNQFLKDYNLAHNYEKTGLSEWKLKDGISDDIQDYSREVIFSFFEQVNKFGEVFSKITWNHRQRRSDYNITDLIDIYDLPGFGGKEEHDRTISAIFEIEKFDVLVYLIDTSCGIPSKEEMGYLSEVLKYLKLNPDTSFYWAYEKPSSDEIDIKKMLRQINDAVNQGGLKELEDNAKGLLDFTGPIDGDDDELRSRLLVDVLKPYFVDIGQKYRNEIAGFNSIRKQEGHLLWQIFSMDDSWPLIEEILGDLEKLAKEKINKRETLSKQDARNHVRKFLIGDEKDGVSTGTGPSPSFRHRLFSGTKHQKSQMPQEKDCVSDREYAIDRVKERIVSSIDQLLKGLYNIAGKLSLTELASFKNKVFDRSREGNLHMLLFDLQMYWILKDRDGVSGFIKSPMTDSLCDNVADEVKAIEDFSFDDD